jgi:hypothetical protein
MKDKASHIGLGLLLGPLAFIGGGHLLFLVLS